MSSHWEGLSLDSLEGMAVGKPFIVSDVPGLSELVKGAGILFEKGNTEQLVSIIKVLLKDDNKYNKISKACLLRTNHFNVKNGKSLY